MTSMLGSFFTLAMVSPGRQRSLRLLAVSHVVFLAVLGFGLSGAKFGAVLIGQALLVAGIVEGALLLGWRLTQLPKSQALEFLLVSPIRPPFLLLTEAAVGTARLILVTFAGLPILILLAHAGILVFGDIPALLLMPLAWGAVTGLGLTFWAFEPEVVRRWGERVLIGCILFYLVVGVLAGENIAYWLAWFPPLIAERLMSGFRFFHHYNPFGVMKYALEYPPELACPRVLALVLTGAALASLAAARAALRLQGHFHDRHYRPCLLNEEKPRPAVGDRPLRWWAVKRVSEYSGRINLWLAGGFGLLYAAYVVAGDSWPPWLGKQAFVIFDNLGGVPTLVTALILLAAVPAAYQYGLWDSNAQDRCRRLELLLLTRLDGLAYWEAAAAAAWSRGRGYFVIASALLGAAVLAGKLTLSQGMVSLSAGVVLWGLYFALGFRAFTRGHQANLLGLILTLGLPLATFVLYRAGHEGLAALTPPGAVYFPASKPWTFWWAGAVAGAGLALVVGVRARRRCDRDLRRWYDRHHGQKVLD